MVKGLIAGRAGFAAPMTAAPNPRVSLAQWFTLETRMLVKTYDIA
jgi:hypothetical protein